MSASQGACMTAASSYFGVMVSVEKVGIAVLVVLSLSIGGCGDDAANGNSSELSDTSDGDTSTGSTTLPSTTMMSSSTGGSSTTTPSTDTTEDSSSTAEEDSTSSSSSSSSSSTGEDIDLVCEGPPGDDTCDTPSPYNGDGD